MKNIFKIIAVSFAMIAGIGSVSAQDLKQSQDRPEVVAKKQVSEMNDALQLTGDQQRTIFRALVSKASNYKKHVDGKNASDAKVIANKKKFDDVHNKIMKKTLTAEQYKKWLAMN